jgi:hypothetical protein
MDCARPCEGNETVFRYAEVNLMLLALRKVFQFEIFPLMTHWANVRKLRSYVCSMSFGKQQAGNSCIRK